MGAERVIYVVDDDPAVRRSVERLLSSAGFDVATFATLTVFLQGAACLLAGCVLLDLQMPEIDALAVLAHPSRIRLDLPVIVVTDQGDVQSAVRSMKAGAVDFIEKPYSDGVLIAAIEAALRRSPRQNQVDEIAAAAAVVRTLSLREGQVLEALVAGHANKTIAFDLGLSVRTVEGHRARMMDRLGVRQLGEAVRLAVLARLAEGPDGGVNRI